MAGRKVKYVMECLEEPKDRTTPAKSKVLVHTDYPSYKGYNEGDKILVRKLRYDSEFTQYYATYEYTLHKKKWHGPSDGCSQSEYFGNIDIIYRTGHFVDFQDWENKMEFSVDLELDNAITADIKLYDWKPSSTCIGQHGYGAFWVYYVGLDTSSIACMMRREFKLTYVRFIGESKKKLRAYFTYKGEYEDDFMLEHKNEDVTLSLKFKR